MPARRAQEPLTAKRKATFLASLRSHGVFARAARDASPKSATGAVSTFREEARRDPEFAAQIQDAVECAHGDLLHELIRRAKDGVSEVVYGPSGQPIGDRRRYSDRLLLEAVRTRFPEFTRRQQLEHTAITSSGPDLSDLRELSHESRADLRRILERELALRDGEPSAALPPGTGGH